MGCLTFISFFAVVFYGIYEAFKGCCTNYDILMFNFLYHFVCIFIAIPILYFFGKKAFSLEIKSSGIIVFRMVVLVIASVLLIFMTQTFLEPTARYFIGYDASNWIKSGPRTIKTEVRSGMALALIVWCFIGSPLVIKYLKEINIKNVKAEPTELIKRDSFDL
jgi:hypothetical protein